METQCNVDLLEAAARLDRICPTPNVNFEMMILAMTQLHLQA